MKIITAHYAINFVDLVMTLLVTTHVTKMETKPAWKVGWEKSVSKVMDFFFCVTTRRPVAQGLFGAPN